MLLAVLASAALALAGCGGGSDKESTEHGGGEEADQGQADALNKIPVADRTAFFEIASALGTVRARAAPVAVGTSAQLTSAAPLVAARARVAALRPADQQLVRLRDQTVPLLTSFAHSPASGPAARRAARLAIAGGDRIEAGLRAYTQRVPAIGGAIPD
jgi:hypothetical protein